MSNNNPIIIFLAVMIMIFLFFPLVYAMAFGIYKTVTTDEKRSDMVYCTECGYSESLFVFHERNDPRGHNFVLENKKEEE